MSPAQTSTGIYPELVEGLVSKITEEVPPLTYRRQLKKLLKTIGQVFVYIDADETFSAEDKTLVKQFFLEELFSPKVRVLRERFPDDFDAFDLFLHPQDTTIAPPVSNQAVPVTPDGPGSRQNGELEQMLSASEVALRLQLSPKTIYSYAKRGLIPHRRIQTNLLFVESELADLFKARKLKSRKQNDDNQQPDHSPELPVEIQT